MRRRRAEGSAGLGLFERLLFSVMGPPQVGDVGDVGDAALLQVGLVAAHVTPVGRERVVGHAPLHGQVVEPPTDGALRLQRSTSSTGVHSRSKASATPGKVTRPS